MGNGGSFQGRTSEEEQTRETESSVLSLLIRPAMANMGEHVLIAMVVWSAAAVLTGDLRVQAQGVDISIIADVLDITSMQRINNNSSNSNKNSNNSIVGNMVSNSTPAANLFFGSLMGDVDRVKNALAAGADVKGKNRQGFSALHAAAFKGHADIIRLLLLSSANPNVTSDNGATPLHLSSSAEVSSLLLEADADKDARDDDGKTPLWFAAINGNSDVVSMLLKEGANVSLGSYRSGTTPIFVAAQEGHLDVVQKLAAFGADPEDENKRRQTTLFMASALGHMNVVEFLVGKRAFLEKYDEEFRTPLFIASCLGHTEVAMTLLHFGADPNARNSDGQTPLFCAARAGKDSIVEMLLRAPKVDANAFDDDQMTPLYAAAYYGHTATVKAILNTKEKNMVDVNSRNIDGFTPLHVAAQQGHLEVVQLLVEVGEADLTAETLTGANCLYWACNRGREQVVRYLIEKGVDKYHKDEFGRSLLFASISGNNTNNITMLLLLESVDPNEPSEDKWTPLHLAASMGLVDVIKMLHEIGGADLSARNGEGRTAMEVAEEVGEEEAVMVLEELEERRRQRLSFFAAGQVGKAQVERLFMDKRRI